MPRLLLDQACQVVSLDVRPSASSRSSVRDRLTVPNLHELADAERRADPTKPTHVQQVHTLAPLRTRGVIQAALVRLKGPNQAAQNAALLLGEVTLVIPAHDLGSVMDSGQIMGEDSAAR